MSTATEICGFTFENRLNIYKVQTSPIEYTSGTFQTTVTQIKVRGIAWKHRNIYSFSLLSTRAEKQVK